MSLVKRLWIVVGLIMLAAMLTAASVNMLSAKRYLENEIKIKNLDTATALALSISQRATDTTMVELLVSSQFDLGHYKRIDYMGPDGKLLLHRELEARKSSAPGWFMQLVPVEPEPGVAEIQSGWRQLGSIKLQSDPSFAYDSIWKSALTLSELFMAGAILVGVLGTLFIRSVIRPLNRVVDQAEALAQRRFMEIKPPGTLEFRLIVQAMNRLSQKIKNILDDESSRLQKLKANYENDELTGYMVRDVFLRNVATEIEREDTEEEGALLLVRVSNLMELNREIGHTQTDELIQALAVRLRDALQKESRVRFGRLNASDLAVLLPGQTDRMHLLQILHDHIFAVEGDHLMRVSLSAAGYASHSNLADLLAVCDQSLMPVTGEGLPAHAGGAVASGRVAREWRQIFATALRNHEFHLETFPVRGANYSYLHTVALARLYSSEAGEILMAGNFLPWARKQGLGGQVDWEILSKTLTELKTHEHDICVTLGFQSICDEHQSKLIAEYLARNKQAAQHLYLNVPEEIAFEHASEFRRFCELVIPIGCKIGVQHLDRYVGHLGRLHGLGIHYIKVSRSLCQEIADDSIAPIMLRSLCTIAHTMGLQVIAEGVMQRTDADLLFDLGFDGVAGPGIV